VLDERVRGGAARVRCVRVRGGGVRGVRSTVRSAQQLRMRVRHEAESGTRSRASCALLLLLLAVRIGSAHNALHG
jgi:hypothetical protein